MDEHIEIVQVGPGKGWPRVEGRCPCCGLRSLFVASGGYVTCANLSCSEPDAASTALGVPAATGATS
jgi:hypothetical protein